jgi:predicted transcriptional regulator of viral defense system
MATKLKTASDIGSQIIDRIGKPSTEVWTASDFADLGTRTAIDKALQRLAATGELRRIDRGLYDRPSLNRLTGKPNDPGAS